MGDFIQKNIPTLSIEQGFAPSGLVCTGYAFRKSSGRAFVQEIAAGPDTFQFSSPTFNGFTDGTGAVYSSAQQSHPGVFNLSQADSGHSGMAYDGRPYLGAAASGNTAGVGLPNVPATPIGGYGWRFDAVNMPSIQMPYQKSYPIQAFAGTIPMVNVSGPGSASVFDTSAAGAYTYCIAALAGECQAGSTAGQTFANVPRVYAAGSVQVSQSQTLAGTLGTGAKDISISGAPAIRDAWVQVDTSATSFDGSHARILTKFTSTRNNNVFMAPQGMTANGKWMVIESHLAGDGSWGKQMLLVKIPPNFTPDGINRLLFEPISVTIPQRANAEAWVRFGYQEFGAPSNLYCTSRRETCTASGTSTTFSTTDPFRYETVESGSISPLDVSGSSGTIQIPAIPTRILYAQTVYRDKTSHALTALAVSAVAVP